MDNNHESLTNHLVNRSFDKLEIRRFEEKCYLIIHHDGVANVLTNKNGKPKEYRHAWQIKDWLYEKYGIEEHEITFS